MQAYATLVTNADFALGALTLARSLRRVGATRPLLVLATSGAGGLEALQGEGCRVIEVAPLPVSEALRERHAKPALHTAAPFDRGGKPAFHDPLENFQKLRLWQLGEYRKLVYLDADTVVLRSIERLFDYPGFAAAPNLYTGLADLHRLNSGVFVAEPDPALFDAMLARLDAPDAFWRRTDQTFLEAFFPDWHGLPFTYNTLQYVFVNLPELWRWEAIRVLHYQYEKPWQADHPKRDRLGPLIDVWWRIHDGRELPERIEPPSQ